MIGILSFFLPLEELPLLLFQEISMLSSLPPLNDVKELNDAQEVVIRERGDDE